MAFLPIFAAKADNNALFTYMGIDKCKACEPGSGVATSSRGFRLNEVVTILEARLDYYPHISVGTWCVFLEEACSTTKFPRPGSL